jgi:hypothetical protein
MIRPARPITVGHRHVEFIEVGAGAPGNAPGGAAADATAVVIADVPEIAEEERASVPGFAPDQPGWSLWGDLDR